MEITVTMQLDRETKNTYRFAAVEEDGPIDTLYIKKAAFNGDKPAAVTVSVEAK